MHILTHTSLFQNIKQYIMAIHNKERYLFNSSFTDAFVGS